MPPDAFAPVADSILAEAFAALGEAPGQPEVDPNVRDDLAIRVRGWFLEAINHPIWKDWMPAAEEDMQFYIGGRGQWGRDGNYEGYEKLKAKGRAILSINHIQAPLDLMSGYQRANRVDMKAVPQGGEDVEDARTMSWFLKYAQDKLELQDLESEMFDEGNITGMDAAKIGIEYTGERPTNGEITAERLRPGHDLLWDPFWRKYSLQDCRYILEFKWAFLEDLVAEYPDHEADLRAAVGALDAVFRSFRGEGKGSSRTGADNYGYVRQHPVQDIQAEANFYNAGEQQLLVVEVWYQVYYAKYSVFDVTTGKVTFVDTKAEADALIQGDPEHLQLHRQEQRKVRMGTVIPATYHVMEEDKKPFPNDDESYPYVAYFYKRKRNTIYGLVRNMKDPQRFENKRISNAMDLMQNYSNPRRTVPKGALRDPQILSDLSDDSVIVYDKEKGEPGFYAPNVTDLAAAHLELATYMKQNMREIPGINAELLGDKQEAGLSGVAMARRQQQGQIISTGAFDHIRRTRKLMAQRMARRIQQVSTVEDQVLLTNDLGEQVPVFLNPSWLPKVGKLSTDEIRRLAQEHGADAKARVLRDPSSLKYDIVLDEAPSTPTARAAALFALVEIARSFPPIAPALYDYILELTDVPHKAELLQRVKRLMGPQITGEPPTQPQNPLAAPEAGSGGTPAGQPPAPALPASAAGAAPQVPVAGPA